MTNSVLTAGEMKEEYQILSFSLSLSYLEGAFKNSLFWYDLDVNNYIGLSLRVGFKVPHINKVFTESDRPFAKTCNLKTPWKK